jgi:multidrug resistance efflux pump
MPKQPRIRTPIRQWWQRLRYQYVPYLTFLGSVALVLYLWQRQLGQPNAVGEVAALRVDATSPSEGKLIAVPGDPLRLAADVKQGQVLALIDDGPLLAELAALQVELLELQGQIPATIASERAAELDRNADQATELRRQDSDARRERTDLAAERRRLDERLERLRLEEIQRRAEALVYRVTYEVQSAKAKRLEELSSKNLLDLRGSVEAYDAQAARDEAKQGLDGVTQSLESIQQLRDHLTKTAAELDAYERTIENPVESLQALQERERLLARLDQLHHQEELLRAQSRMARVETALRRAHAGYASRLGHPPTTDSIPLETPGANAASNGEGEVTSAIEAIRQDRTKLLEQLRALGLVGGGNLDQQLTPIHAAIDAKCRQIELVCAQYELLEVRAPVTGTIATVWARPGQTVTVGALVATIAAPDSEYIVSYIRQENPLRPEAGMIVEVRPRRKPLESFPASVASVGPQVELIPEHQRMMRDANQLEWGLPVRINVPAEGKLRPGELVDLRFHARPTQ